MKNKRIKIYIASPYRLEDKEENVRLQIDAYYHLIKMGFNPYMPVYTHFIVKQHPDIDTTISWLEIDKEWLDQCDIMIRLHPKNELGVEILSSGANEEEEFAKEKNIPVYHFETIEEMINEIKIISDRFTIMKRI